MNIRVLSLFVASLWLFAGRVIAQVVVPEPLLPWVPWVLGGNPVSKAPPSYSDEKVRVPLWASELVLEVTGTGASFSVKVDAFAPAWLGLPGSAGLWPQEVATQLGVAVVVPRPDEKPAGGKGDAASFEAVQQMQQTNSPKEAEVAVAAPRAVEPATKLPAGTHTVTGKFAWSEIPERLFIPVNVGILRLRVDGVEVPSPNWDADGWLWLKRQKAETTDKDFFSAKVYRLLMDGQPLWLQTQLELSVAGKSREEELGQILPSGWKLAKVESPLPFLAEENGTAKAQVRAGKWVVKVSAFRTESPAEISYPAGAKRLVEEELLALGQTPSFRMVELLGLTLLDANQTTFPQEWRRYPVYQWMNAKPFQLEEKMRGMGLERPAGLTVERQWWLDEDGKQVTIQDKISGEKQLLWRVDASPGQRLGAIKVDDGGQLVTKNPTTGNLGVELRQPTFSVQSSARAEVTPAMSAVGWETNAGKLSGTLHLPPGWRLLALFGPDSVDGDWLTEWSLLDVFLLLVFSMAVGRLWGWGAGAVAFLVFILSYHEVGAPRWSWLWLILVLALLRVGKLRELMPSGARVMKLLTLVFLTWRLALFVNYQITALLYPQLEVLQDPNALLNSRITLSAPSSMGSVDFLPGGGGDSYSSEGKAKKRRNMQYEKQVKIQTGPALPNWQWRAASYSYRGPVNAKQTMTPVLLSSGWQRVLIAVRLVLIGTLLWLLLRRRTPIPLPPPLPQKPGGATPAVAALLVLGWLALPTPVEAQTFPPSEMLEDLKSRLEKVDTESFPNAAAIADAKMSVEGGKITLDLEIHAVVQVAVPLPGKLPAWSPLQLLVDDKPAIAMRRANDLWVIIDKGVHRCRMEGIAPSGSEWEWAFKLKPARLTVHAPGWTVTGLPASGVPEAQIFFVQQAENAKETAAYDRREFNALVQVTRNLELGLTWQVRTVVTRLTPTGKAVSVSIPLLTGERLLSPGLTTQGGRMEVRLGGQETQFEWESELIPTTKIQLVAEKTDRWVEEWKLEASPVWNVSLQGLKPVFDRNGAILMPVWRPWPGETADLSLSQPTAVEGETLTVARVEQQLNWGKQQRTNTLTLEFETSLGRDLPLGLPTGAEVTSVEIGGQYVPARQVNNQWIVAVRPGKQTLLAKWTLPKPLLTKDSVEPLTLPVDVANAKISVQLPRDRWVLWADGPMRGPAVRFYGILLVSLIFACLLAKFTTSPLGWWQWGLLLSGLTQVDTLAAFLFVGWVLLLAWRGRNGRYMWSGHANMLQIFLACGAVVCAGILVWVLRNGLLGSPRMFIAGEGSTAFLLNWYEARGDATCPTPSVVSVSIWAFRGLMLLWALWLAWALLGWIRWGWTQFSEGGLWRERELERPNGPVAP